MDMQKEREAFEAWFKTTTTYKTLQDFIYIHQPSIKSVFAKKNGRAYLNDCVQIAWEAWQAAKSSAVPEGRTDFEIIEQTIAIVDLLADANRFKRDKSKPFPFESENPRNIEWWRVACQIRELLTDTDPNNCDFEEYKAMIEAAQEQDQ